MDSALGAHPRLGFAAHAAVVAGYLVLALWLTWPVAAHLGSRYYTGGEGIFFFPSTPDAPQNIWNFWLAERSLASGRSPLFTTLLYHPEGVQMILQTMNMLAVLMALPVTAALGPTAAYNATAIVALALTGYAGFLLARAFAPGVAGPFLAGALLTASPFHIAKLDSGQLNFVTMQWLVLFMLAWVALSRQGRWWRVPVAALAFAAVLYTDWYWALAAALFGALWAALSLVGAARPWVLVGRYAAFGLLAALAAAPLALAMRDAPTGGQGRVSEQWAVYTQGYSADALGLLFPAARHPLWAAPAERFLVGVAPYAVTEGSYTAAGWTLAALGALGALWYGRRQWRLLAVAAVAWLLAVGPTLYVLGRDTGLAMPYRLLQALPLLETARRPNLFGVVTIVVAAVFAALAVAGLRERLPRRRYALAVGALAAVGLFELWPSARVANALERPEVFARIAGEPGVVVDLPIEGDTNSRTLINQMVHGQPILRGYVARPPRYVTLEHSPLLAELGHMRPLREDDIIALDPEALATMQCYYRLRHVVLDKSLLTGAEQRFVAGAVARLGGEVMPWYDDERFRAYRLPLAEDACAPFVFLGDGWAEPERDGELLWRWSGAEAELWAVNPHAEARTVRLTLTAVGREDGQPLTVWRGDERVADFALSTARRRYTVILTLPPGTQLLRLTTPVATEDGGGRRLGASVLGVEIAPAAAPDKE